MLLYPEWLLAARCPSCLGQFVYRPISAFEINSREEKHISCYEGTEIFSCCLSGRSHLRVCITGPCCDEPHSFLYNLDELAAPGAIEMVCLDTGINLGYLGEAKAVMSCLNEDFRELVRYCGTALDVFWLRPDLMERVFSRINELYAEHNVSCGCGSKSIDIETVSGEGIRLVCRDCYHQGSIYADRDVHWQILKHAGALLIDDGRVRLRRPRISLHGKPLEPLGDNHKKALPSGPDR